MSRYIDADKIEYYRDCDECHEECQLGCTEPFVIAYREDIDDIPTEDVTPVIHAKWIPHKFVDKSFRKYECSNCGEFVYDREYQIKYHKFCLHCGAKMDGE